MHRVRNHSDLIELLLYKLEPTEAKAHMRPEPNHKRAHFHIRYKTMYSASYAVDNLERLSGNMPSMYEKPILEWAKDKRTSLLATWRDLNAGKDVRKFVIVEEKPQP